MCNFKPNLISLPVHITPLDITFVPVVKNLTSSLFYKSNITDVHVISVHFSRDDSNCTGMLLYLSGYTRILVGFQAPKQSMTSDDV